MKRADRRDEPPGRRRYPRLLGMLALAVLLAWISASCGHPGGDTRPDATADTGTADTPSPAAEVGASDAASPADGGDGALAADGGPDAAEPSSAARACLLAPDCERIMVAAHRGFHVLLPENSLAALRAAAELGADFVEVDVRHTQDDVLVLMHDGDVDRTTDGSGAVSGLTWEQIRALRLKRGEPTDAEASRVPLFVEALSLARELGVMLYVDQKTNRTDLVLAAIAEDDDHDVALVRDDFLVVAAQAAEDPALLVLPAIDAWETFLLARELIPDVRIVELTQGSADAELTARIRGAGVKVQQDVMGGGDVIAYLGDYTGWKAFVEAGVSLPQTDLPHLLVPAVQEYERTGEFPDSGPGVLQ